MKIIMEIKGTPFKKMVKIDGWSWGAFLLGVLWYWGHGMWGKGFWYLLIALLFSWTVIVPIALWFVMGSKFNSERYKHLSENGYTIA